MDYTQSLIETLKNFIDQDVLDTTGWNFILSAADKRGIDIAEVIRPLSEIHKEKLLTFLQSKKK